MTALKAIKVGYDKMGTQIVLCEDSVWVHKSNYRQGRIVKQWAWAVKGVSFNEAEKVFNRRTLKN